MVAAPFSTVLYKTYGPKVAISIMALLPMMMVPLIYNLHETKNMPVTSTKAQCTEIWNTVRSRAVWQPMGFVSLIQKMKNTAHCFSIFILTNFLSSS